ncbi:MAG: 23S rRNA (adenine(2503)-C(2))-methyltransferase RlmN [Spirochaetota bacterium]
MSSESQSYTSLFGYLPPDLAAVLPNEPAFRRKQLFGWVQKGVTDFDQMLNIPKSLRKNLRERGYTLFSSAVQSRRSDPDGTTKLTIKLDDGAVVECVLLIDDQGRKTACLSSQVGCAMGCAFCRTGTMGLVRDLTAAEIVEQYFHLYNLFGPITHIVYMGMGEPLVNLNEVTQSIAIFHHDEGLHISLRRITLSTCGIVPGIRELAKTGPYVRLAVSLTASENSLRSSLMPINNAYPLEELHSALQTYQKASKRRITLEYVMLGGVNDTKEDARGLVEFSRGLHVMVNMIPWNPAAELEFEEPTAKAITEFSALLTHAGIPVTRRYRRGRGVNGACGQLAADTDGSDN